MVSDTCEVTPTRLVWRSLAGVGRRYARAQLWFLLLPAEDGHELGLDHATKDVGPGNHSHQFSFPHDRHPDDIMRGHLGDHYLYRVVLLDADRRSAHDLLGFHRLQVFSVLHRFEEIKLGDDPDDHTMGIDYRKSAVHSRQKL